MTRYFKISGLALPLVSVVLGLFVFMHLTMPECEVCPTVPETSATPAATETRAAFERVYREGEWGVRDGVGTSGSGSTLDATLLYRSYLEQFMKQRGIKSVVDAGCGDWEFSQHIDWTGIDYKGYDIVANVVEANKQKFAKPNIQFFTANIVEDDLPAADLLIAKHVLQHLPNDEVQKFLAKQLGKYKHVLLTDAVDPKFFTAKNVDIRSGEYRELDVTEPPFNVRGIKKLLYWANFHMHQVVHVDNTKPVR